MFQVPIAFDNSLDFANTVTSSQSIYFNNNNDHSLNFGAQYLSQSSYYIPKPPPSHSSHFIKPMDTNSSNNKRKLEMSQQAPQQFLYNTYVPNQHVVPDATVQSNTLDINMKILTNQIAPTSICTQQDQSPRLEKKDTLMKVEKQMSCPNFSTVFVQPNQIDSNNSIQPNSANSSPNSFPFPNTQTHENNGKVEFSPISISPPPTDETNTSNNKNQTSPKNKKGKSKSKSTTSIKTTTTTNSLSSSNATNTASPITSTPTPNSTTIPSPTTTNNEIEIKINKKKPHASRRGNSKPKAPNSSSPTPIQTPVPTPMQTPTPTPTNMTPTKNESSVFTCTLLQPPLKSTSVSVPIISSTPNISNFQSYSSQIPNSSNYYIPSNNTATPISQSQDSYQVFDSVVNSVCTRFNMLMAELSPYQTAKFINYVCTTLQAHYPFQYQSNVYNNTIESMNSSLSNSNEISKQSFSTYINHQPSISTDIKNEISNNNNNMIPINATNSLNPTLGNIMPTLNNLDKSLKTSFTSLIGTIHNPTLPITKTPPATLPNKRSAESQSFHSGTKIKPKPKKKKQIKRPKSYSDSIDNDFIINRRSPLAAVDIYLVVTESVLNNFNEQELNKLSKFLPPGENIEDIFKNKYFIESLAMYKANLGLGNFEDYDVPSMTSDDGDTSKLKNLQDSTNSIPQNTTPTSPTTITSTNPLSNSTSISENGNSSISNSSASSPSTDIIIPDITNTESS